jgi:hypothetical protein
MLPDFGRADRIGEFWGYPESRAFAELLIDCEEGPNASASRRSKGAKQLSRSEASTSSIGHRQRSDHSAELRANS